MDLNRFRGLAVALVTPFQENGAVDRERLRHHVTVQIDGGVDMLVPCGTTGESATLAPEEQLEVIAEAVEVAAGRVPVMAGASSNRTDQAVRYAQAAQEAGADAILSLCPYYNKPTQEGLYAHFEAIAGSISVPLFIYNVPGRTASNIKPGTLLRLAELANVAGVKEASGDLDQVMTILRERPDGFLVLSGDDALALPIIALGGDGVVSVVANESPDIMAELVHSALDGDLPRARKAHYRLLPVMRANFVETNPIPVKTALAMMGQMDAHFRLPLTPLTPAGRRTLELALESAGLR